MPIVKVDEDLGIAAAAESKLKSEAAILSWSSDALTTINRFKKKR